jgi:serine/threonine-protein kinase
VPTEVDGALVEIAKVLDFGISKIRGSETVKTQESTLLGTPQYMAPEQAKGEHANCDERTDVFAFGTIVYEMLCGHPAFQGASIPEVVFKVVYEQPMPISEAAPGVSAAVASAVTQSMAKLADQRFRNVSAFVEAMTGQAVSQFRVPAVLPVEPGQDSGSRARSTGPRSTGNDAFAQTMGSGDHGASSVAGVDETASANAPAPATSLPPVAKSGTQIGQPTLPASGSQPVIGGPGVLTVESLGVPPVRRRSRGVLVAVGLASVVLAAAVIYFVTRGGPAKQPQVAAGDAALRVVTAPDAAALAPDATVVAVVVDAGVPRATPDAAVAVKKPVVKPPPVHDPEPGPDEPGGDDKIGQDLKQAEASLASGKLEAAERFANAVINASGNVRQHARAHAIRGVVMCTRHNDEERAQIDLRNIAPRFPGIRHTLIAACHAHGLLGSVSR